MRLPLSFAVALAALALLSGAGGATGNAGALEQAPRIPKRSAAPRLESTVARIASLARTDGPRPALRAAKRLDIATDDGRVRLEVAVAGTTGAIGPTVAD